MRINSIVNRYILAEMTGMGIILRVRTAREHSLPIDAWLHFIKQTAKKCRIPIR